MAKPRTASPLFRRTVARWLALVLPPRRLALLYCAGAVLAILAARRTTDVTFYVGQRHGMQFPTAEAIGRLIRERDDRWRVGVVPGAGSFESLQRLRGHPSARGPAMALTGLVAASEARDTQGFSSLTTLVPLFPEVLQLYVSDDLRARLGAPTTYLEFSRAVGRELGDRQRAVYVGRPGSLTQRVALQLLSDANPRWQYRPKQADDLGFGEALRQLSEGTLVACFISAGLPTPAVTTWQQTQSVPANRMPLSLPEEYVRSVAERIPFLSPSPSYLEYGPPFQSVQSDTLLVADDHVDPDLVVDTVDAVVAGSSRLAHELRSTYFSGPGGLARWSAGTASYGLPSHPWAAITLKRGAPIARALLFGRALLLVLLPMAALHFALVLLVRCRLKVRWAASGQDSAATLPQGAMAHADDPWLRLSAAFGGVQIATQPTHEGLARVVAPALRREVQALRLDTGTTREVRILWLASEALQRFEGGDARDALKWARDALEELVGRVYQDHSGKPLAPNALDASIKRLAADGVLPGVIGRHCTTVQMHGNAAAHAIELERLRHPHVAITAMTALVHVLEWYAREYLPHRAARPGHGVETPAAGSDATHQPPTAISLALRAGEDDHVG